MSNAEAKRQARNQIADLKMERARASGTVTQAWRSAAARAIRFARNAGLDREEITDFVKDRTILVFPV
ncbi:hypothetical protein [Brevundimonas naejangsanensis]|uniref:hypothetical protein n=1 Tax=Brevundimonas naejangsanensis TaxID=588932 RepID=UPI0012DE3453|nr:hypothetical protein [Brevundimonas naejangsanensis]